MGEGIPESSERQKGSKSEEGETRSGDGLTRRQALFGGIGALITGASTSPEAHAQERELRDRVPSIETILTPEQRATYQEGIRRLRDSAETNTEESVEIFFAYSNGTGAWKPFSNPVVGETFAVDERGTTQAHHPNPAMLAEAREVIRAGGRVEIVHTHTTHTRENQTRVDSTGSPTSFDPVSNIDLVGSVRMFPELTDEEQTRVSFQVVAQDGAFRYRPSSPDTARALREAFTPPPIEFLLGEEARELRNSFRIISTVPESDEELLEWLKDPIAVDTLASNHLESLSNDRSYRMFLTFVRRGRDETQERLRRIDRRTDGRIAERAFRRDQERFLNRWRGLGMSIERVPWP